MTREEAREVFLNRGFVNGLFNGDKWRDACVVISEWLEQEPCEDCIARQPLIERWNCCADMLLEEGDSAVVMKWIFDAPSVTPTHKKGKWIEVDTNRYTCSECCRCFTIDPEDNDISEFNYCPNCGLRMEDDE